MGLTTTKRKLLNNGGVLKCTGTSKYGGSIKYNGNCNNLENIVLSENTVNVKYSKQRKKLKDIYKDLGIPFPVNSVELSKLKDVRSIVVSIEDELYYIEVGSKNIYIKLPGTYKSYINRGSVLLNKADANRNKVYQTAKGVARAVFSVAPA